MRKTILALLTLFVLILSACAVQQQAPTEYEKPKQLQGSYKIGVMLPLTGDGAAYGLPEQKGVK